MWITNCKWAKVDALKLDRKFTVITQLEMVKFKQE